jgi:hypothetical protein
LDEILDRLEVEKKMKKKDFYRLEQTARRVRRLLLKKLGVQKLYSGLCGTAAIPLCAELRNKGFNAIIVNGNMKIDTSPGQKSHYWVEVEGCIIDITGDQFNDLIVGQKLPEVLIAPYALLPRYIVSRKDGIKLDGDLNNFLTEWLQTI